MRATALGLGLVLLAAARHASAEELTAQEKTWAKACVAGLAAPTARQRESAAAALARMGVEAMPTVMANAALLKTDEHWAALESACRGMGTAEAVAWLEASKDWPKACVVRLQAMLDRLRSGRSVARSSGPPLPKSPDDVAAKVTSILDSFRDEAGYRSDDTRIDQLVALGRPALGALLAAMREGSDLLGWRKRAAVEALEQLVLPEDTPLLAQMLADGHLALGPALRKLPAEQAVPALLVPVEKGQLSFELLEGVKHFHADPRVPKALLAWLAGRSGEGRSTVCGSVAEVLAEARVKDAVPVLAKMLASAAYPMSRRRLASALADLGDKRGVETLVAYFRAPTEEFSNLDRHEAGRHLNKVVGREVYRGTFGTGDRPEIAARGNFDEALKEFETWWAASKDRLRYDEERRAWVVGP